LLAQRDQLDRSRLNTNQAKDISKVAVLLLVKKSSLLRFKGIFASLATVLKRNLGLFLFSSIYDE